MNSRFITGLGAPIFTGPVRVSVAIRKSMARTKSASWIHDRNRVPLSVEVPGKDDTNLSAAARNDNLHGVCSFPWAGR